MTQVQILDEFKRLSVEEQLDVLVTAVQFCKTSSINLNRRTRLDLADEQMKEIRAALSAVLALK